MGDPVAALRNVKLLHTAVWAVFAGCIFAIPALGASGRFGLAFALVAVVAGEVLVLAFNRWQCPLTGVAARFTSDRRDNFDIYLPLWLARHNKRIFGSLYVAGSAYVVARWAGWLGPSA